MPSGYLAAKTVSKNNINEHDKEFIENEVIITQENIQEYKDNKLLLELQQSEKVLYQEFSKKLHIFFPTMTSSGFVNMYDQGKDKSHLVFVIDTSEPFNQSDLQKIHELAKLKLKTDIEIQ